MRNERKSSIENAAQADQDRFWNNDRSFSATLAIEPEQLDLCVEESVKMLKETHGTLVPSGKLPDMRERALSWAECLQSVLPGEAGGKLLRLFRAVPHDDHLIHGDYRARNQGPQSKEALTIDMDTPAVGNPVFELASMYDALAGDCEREKTYDPETARSFWRKSLAAYLGTNCEHKLQEVENKAKIIAYTRMICRAIRSCRQESDAGRREIETWKRELLELLEKTDTLLSRPDELEIDALRENTEEVQAFVEEKLEQSSCAMKTKMQIAVSVEEIFVNIANYAYKPHTGTAWIRADVSGDPAVLTLVFIDRGTPYNPLAKEDPDVTLSAEDRKIGGLGIYMTKVFMDEKDYAYQDGQNVLTLKKILR